MGHIYSLVNQKGGVGKTTTAINLSAYLAYFGQRVLLVDLDPQANATSSLGIDKNKVQGGTYEVLHGEDPLNYVLHNPRLKFSILPASPSLAGGEVELVGLHGRERRLLDALTLPMDRYDYILIDCPPSLGLLTLNGLVAAQHGALIPVQCEYLALEGLGQLTDTISRIQVSLHPELKIRGVLLTMFDARTNLARDVEIEVRQYFSKLAFNTIIPRSIRLAEAPSHGHPILSHAPTSDGAKAYQMLAHELLIGDGVNIPVPA